MGYGIFGLKRHEIKFFVGSYGSDLTRGVYVFSIDIDNGEILKKRQFYRSPSNPVFMTRKERFIFTCYKNNSGRMTDGGVWQYAAMDVQFGLTARVHNGGKTYDCLAVKDDRSVLYATDYYNGEVSVVPFSKQKVIKFVQTIKHEGRSLDDIKQDRPHPIFVTFNKDETRVIVLDQGTDEIVYYDIIDKGRLEKNEELSFHVKEGNGPRKLLFSKDYKFAYVLNEIANTLEVYKNEDDHLTLIQTVDTFDKSSFDKKSAAGDLAIMDSNEYIFASNRGHDSVAAFKIDNETGMVTYEECIYTDENPKVIQLFNDRWMVVAAQKGGSLESWEIKTNDRHGLLYETNFSYTVAEPVTIVV
jgi:6-phosphogluconolactonase